MPFSQFQNFEMLDITGDHISKLSDEDLRTLVVKLCEAELCRFNLPLSAVTAGGHQNAADGGIDVRVELLSNSSPLDFIPRNVTGFQVKQEDMPPSAIQPEMHPKKKLRPSICELASKQGAYVIVCGKGSTTDSALKDRKSAMQSAISDLPQHASLIHDFYDRDRLARWIRCYPGVALWLRERIGEPLAGWLPYGKWAYGNSVDSEYLLDDKCRIVAPQTRNNTPLTVKQGIQAIRAVLKKPHGIVRLVGLSGTGKTRLVQALFDAKIGNNALDHSIVIYVDQGSDQSPTPSARDMIHRFTADGLRAIIVVDNCNPKMHRDLAQAVSTSDGLVSLITVEYDVSDDEPEETQVFRLEPASDKIIEEILQRLTPNVSQIDRTCIAEFSGGNARIALALARTVEHSGSLATLNDMELFRRLFYQRQNNNNSEALMRTAEACSLVYSFDGESIEGDETELSILAGLADITPEELYRHISELHSRDLVQRRSKWRAVLPHAIANQLAHHALKKIHLNTLTNTFLQSGRERLLKSFSRRLGYLHDSEQAKQMVETWLGSDGPLKNPARLNELGIDMFMNVAPLSPSSALQTIEAAALGDEGKAFLSPENHDRWRWYNLLRSIAYESQYFSRAALLLTRFVAEETESHNHNSAHDSFKELFHLYLSGTHALVEARLDVVQQLFESMDKATNSCGLTALAAMLESLHFNSSHDFTFGGRHRDFGWEPRTVPEISAWFRAVVAFTINQVNSNSLHTSDIKQLLAQHFGELWVCAEICNELEKVARDFATQDGWPDGWLAIRKTIHFDLQKMSPEFAKRTRDLEIMLHPVKLEQKIRAYVLNKQGYFDITDIELDNDSDTAYMQAWDRVNKIVEDLGEEVVSTPDMLASLLPQLLSSDNNMIGQFGRGLAKGTLNIEQAWRQLHNILTTLPESKRNVSLLRGFIEVASTCDSDMVNQLMDEALADPILFPLFPILQSSYPVDEAGAKRLISSIAYGRAPSRTYSCFGQKCSDSIPLPLLRKILLGIASLPDGYQVAVYIFGMRLHVLQRDKVSVDSDISALGRELLKLNEFQDADQNHAYYANEIAVSCMVGDAAHEDAIIICTKLAPALFSYQSGARQFGKLMRTLFRLHPMTAIAAFLNEDLVGKMGGHQHRPLSYFFRFDHENPVNAASPEILMTWARENLEVRLPKLAEEIHLFAKNDEHDAFLWSPLALEILVLAPDRSAILDIYASRFHPSSVRSGSLADNLSPYLALAEKLQTHDDPLAASWAKKQADSLAKEIAEEHKHDRHVDESFE